MLKNKNKTIPLAGQFWVRIAAVDAKEIYEVLTMTSSTALISFSKISFKRKASSSQSLYLVTVSDFNVGPFFKITIN